MKAFTKTLIAATAGLLFVVGGAQAASVEATLFNGLQQLSDNSAEALIDCTPGALGCTGTAGKVDVGDRLRGIFTIETVEPGGGGVTRNLGAGSSNAELTGLFDVTVMRKFSPAPGDPFGTYTFIFEPTASFAAEIGGPVGSMVAFYQDNSPDYSRISPACSSAAIGGNCEQLATTGTGGSLLWVAGFLAGDTNQFWAATGVVTDDIAVVGGLSSAQTGGGFNIGLNLLLNNGTKQLDQVACGFPSATLTTLEFCGSGSLLGKVGSTSPYDSFDNVDFQINVVPEPGSVALTGLALLGLAGASRRRRS